MSGAGKVYLVGAGPGDPELLTLKGRRVLGLADSVLFDHLANDALLDLAPAAAERVYVGKKKADHSHKQEEITAMMIERALAGRTVVRLKGGDPFIFGRGGEEAEACRAAGVPVEVVPGISAAIGAAAAAQLPLTHRNSASVVSFVAGQCKGLAEQDWSGLAGHGRTLVIYMGVATAEAIAEKLIADGLSPAIPVAVIENATRSQMRVLRASLAGLADLIAIERVNSPALIVIGEVCAAHEPAQLRTLALEAQA